MNDMGLLGCRIEGAIERLAGQAVRVVEYPPPRGEHSGPILRVVRVRRDQLGWELTVCGFPKPLEDENID